MINIKIKKPENLNEKTNLNKYNNEEDSFLHWKEELNKNLNLFWELIMDNNDNIYDKDTEVIEHIPVGGSETATLSLSIPIDVAQEWQNGNIDLFAKLYFIFWFGKYDYRLIKFGIVGVSELRGG